MIIPITVLNESFCRAAKDEDVYDAMFNLLSYTTGYMRGKDFVKSKLSLFDRRGGKFGTGLLEFVTLKLDKADLKYKIIDNRDYKIIKPLKTIEIPNKNLESYQIKAINLIDEGIHRGIISAPTAAGKTTIMAGIIKKLRYPETLVICPTADIARNTRESLSKDLEEEIGLLGDKEKDLQEVTICLYQTLRRLNLSEINKIFKMIIVDEAHLAIDAIKDILENLPDIHYRFGLTGTAIMKTKKKEYYKVTSQLGPVVKKITEKQAEKRVINDVNAYMFTFKTKATYDEWQDVYRENLLLNKDRCLLLCKMVKFALKNQKKKNVLLLVDEYEQAKMIKKCAKKIDGLPEPVIAWRGVKEKLPKIKKDINNFKIPWCIATPVFSVGTDIPEIQCVTLGSVRKSISNTIQKIGRGRRRTELSQELLLLDIYDIISNYYTFEKYSQRRRNIYKRKGWLQNIFPFKG